MSAPEVLREQRRRYGVRAPRGSHPTHWLLAADSPDLGRGVIETDWDVTLAPPGRMFLSMDGFVVRINGRQYRTAESWTRETLDHGLCVPVKRIHPDFKGGDPVLFIHNRGLMPWMEGAGKGLMPTPGVIASASCRAEIVVKPNWQTLDTEHRVVIVEEVSWKQQKLLDRVGSSRRRS